MAALNTAPICSTRRSCGGFALAIWQSPVVAWSLQRLMRCSGTALQAGRVNRDGAGYTDCNFWAKFRDDRTSPSRYHDDVPTIRNHGASSMSKGTDKTLPVQCPKCGLTIQVPMGSRRLCSCGTWLSGDKPAEIGE